jgi:hypothetical protein
MAVHAKLSASGAKKWLNCPPSAELEQGFPNSSSVYADEGTHAHSLGEIKIYESLKLPFTGEKKYNKMKIMRLIDKAMGNKFYCEEMNEATQEYADLVFSKYAEALQKTKDAVILLEERLDFSKWVPQGFGTGDVVIVSDGCIEIVDLKYGKGVPVSADENPQMMLYALGAIAKYELLYDLSDVKMTICQPRLDSVSIYQMSVVELLAWGEEYVKPRAQMAIKGEGEYSPGEDTCRWCRAKALCKARADFMMAMVDQDFTDAKLISDNDVTNYLELAPQILKWAKDIQEYAFEQAEKHGKKWIGWKLVEGKSNRKYLDEIKVADLLKKEGYVVAKIYEPQTLLGITALEKAITKKQFNALLSDLVIKPTGKPTLVPESDKRDEICSTASAESDFGPVDESLLD